MAWGQSLVWELRSHIKPLHTTAKNKKFTPKQEKKKKKSFIRFSNFYLNQVNVKPGLAKGGILFLMTSDFKQLNKNSEEIF